MHRWRRDGIHENFIEGFEFLRFVNVYNGMVFKKNHIPTSNDFLVNRVLEPVAEFFMGIANEDALLYFVIWLGSFILGNMD